MPLVQKNNGRIVEIDQSWIDNNPALFNLKSGWKIIKTDSEKKNSDKNITVSLDNVPATSNKNNILLHVLDFPLENNGVLTFIKYLIRYSKDKYINRILCTENLIGSLENVDEIVIFKHKKELVELLDKIKPLIIHCHNPKLFDNLVIKYPWIGTFHDWKNNEELDVRSNRNIIPICHHVNRIDHGVDIDLFKPLNHVKKDWKLTIGIICKLNHTKFPIEFMRELVCNRSRIKDIQFVHIGGSKYQDEIYLRELDTLKQFKIVDFKGYIENNKLPEEINKLDCLLCLSKADSVNYTVLEAMSCNVPVLYLNENTGISKVVSSNGKSFNKISDITSYLIQLSNNKTELNKLKSKCRECVTENYNADKQYPKYLEIYDNLITKKKLPEIVNSNIKLKYKLNNKPVILHIFSFPARPGGIITCISSLAEQMPHISHQLMDEYNFDSPKDILKTIPFIEKIYHSKNETQSIQLVKEIDPILLHYHYPTRPYLTKEFNNVPTVFTYHSWKTNQILVDKQIPITGNHYNVIRHGINLNRFYPMKNRKESNILTIGISGRISDEKIPQSFINWLNGGLPSNVKMKIAGKAYFTNHRKIEEDLTNAGCEMLGEVDYKDMLAFYNSIDILLVPSSMESCSISAMEAMACNVVVIGRNIEGIPITLGNAGILYNNDCELTRIIRTLRDNKEYLNRLKTLSRQRAIEYFDAREMANKYLIEYSKLTNRIIQKESKLDCSVGIAVYNTKPEWLSQCVNSVLQQKDVNFEIVIVDDGSTKKETIEMLIKLALNPKVRLIRRDHLGVSYTMTDTIRFSKSNIFCRIDSDDIMPANRLKEQVKYMKDHKDVTLLAGQMRTFRNDNINIEASKFELKYDNTKKIWDQDWCISHPTICIRRDHLLTVNGYDCTALGLPQNAQDLVAWCKLSFANAKIVVSEKIWVYYRMHDNQVSRKLTRESTAMNIKSVFISHLPITGEIVNG